ncbi:hypothetical protein Val02_24780 [Virgisporangium aliadipatigenens]|uniref:DUF3224 domain-containing protein n=1 Tax=Virgisporangium aliadipatigenens TaxID=741659 RepID=A0A8J3YJU7_9ACTN|nr:DUF3224 domain-containing protein [Virgisporangium aliadipatigenens]GIJ45592.1 hypothetical protein Val02_24780 [Virgisporangium aliadipatigenens]
MSEKIELRLKIDNWDEKPYRELADGTKFARAQVALSDPTGAVESAAYEGLLYYAADGTSSYVTLMALSGTFGGRAGSLVLRGNGSYDGTTATGRMTVVPGSGTGGLAGVTGTATSVSTHADYPFMPLTLEIA